MRGEQRELHGEPFTVEHFCEWASYLTLDTDEPWIVEEFQAEFVEDLFTKRASNLLILPEGNAKTTLAAGLGLYYIEHIQRAFVPVAGPSREQAEQLYRQAEGMVIASGLQGRFRCLEGYRRIRCDRRGSRLQIYAAEDRTADGLVFDLAIIDELHRHRDLRLYRTWRGKVQKRGGQLIAISTAGAPDSEFEDARRAFKELASEVEHEGAFTRAIGPETVLHEYAVPDDGDIEDLQQVKAANPLQSITIETLRAKMPGVEPGMTMSHWRRFTCCQASGDLDQPILPEEWDRLKVDIGIIEQGESVILVPSVGHNAAVAIVADRPDERVAVKVEVIDHDDDESMYVRIEQRIVELCQHYDVVAVHHPLVGFARSADLLEAKGVPMVPAPHSPVGLSAASGTFNRLLRSGLLMHDGDTVLRSHVLAASVKTGESGERYVVTDRCRGLIALVMAVHAITAMGEPAPKIHVYKGA
jgi:phage terminase large subunit-like protein